MRESAAATRTPSFVLKTTSIAFIPRFAIPQADLRRDLRKNSSWEDSGNWQ
jgi:hypothetical protein